MKRLERLTAMLSLLQSRRFTELSMIEKKFEISERTVFRDLKALEEAGVPISFEKDKGYFIADRYFLPPLAFTLDEAKSFVFVAELAKKYTDNETFQHFSTALEKIKNKLKDQQLSDIENLQEKVGAFIDEKFTPKFLHTIEQACTKKQVLQIRYRNYVGNITERKIEPIGITFYSQSWHVIAFCQLRKDYRDFSLSRILVLQHSGEMSHKKHLTLSEYIQKIENS